MEPSERDAFRASCDAALPSAGGRSGTGTDELFRLIADEQRRLDGDGKLIPVDNPLPSADAAALASTGMNQPFEDWLRTHRELMGLEMAFTEMAIRATTGEISIEELAERRAVLEATRALCTAAYQRAFPGNQ
jgi:hypothetical protein